MHLAAAGFGVSVVPAAVSQIRAEGAAYLPIAGECPTASIRLGYQRSNASEAVKNFVSTARRHRSVGSAVPRA